MLLTGTPSELRPERTWLSVRSVERIENMLILSGSIGSELSRKRGAPSVIPLEESA